MTRQFSAGGIIFKKDGESFLWLIRKPAPNPEFKGKIVWGFPKGLIDPGEKIEEAALREVREEAGVEAKIIAKLPSIKIIYTNEKKERVLKFITYFVMEWQKDLPDGFGWETGEIKWANLTKALEILGYDSDKKLLHQASDFIKKLD